MLELGVDEATIVLQLNPNSSYNNGTVWEKQAEAIIDKYAKHADFENILGPKISESIAPAGYKIAYHFGSHNWYLALAYHPEHPKMGVVVKYSASALNYYCEHKRIQFYQLMHITADEMYSARLSRIDFIADFIDENLDVKQIYDSLNNKEVGIYDKFDGTEPDKPIFRKRNLEYRGFIVQDDIPTIYLGSVQSDVQARVYNKKREQIECKGTKLSKALQFNNWVRLEVIIKKKYAHQITEALSQIYTDMEFSNLIASVLVQKFRFMKIIDGIPDVETEYTQMLIDQINNNNFNLKASVTNNYELASKIEYLYNGSGVLSTLYKIYDIWGKSAAWDFLAHTLDLMENYSPNDECQSWLMRNSRDYLEKYPTFNDFLSDNLPIILQKKGTRGLQEVTFKENNTPTYDQQELYEGALIEFKKKWNKKQR